MQGPEISTEKKFFFLLGILFLNLLLISTNVILKNKKSLFQNIISFMASPFQIGFQKTVDFISDELSHYVFLKNSYKKYLDLKKDYTRLKYENYFLKKRIAELDAFSGKKFKYKDFLTVDVISIDINFPFNSVIVNRGSKYGIKKDMIVLNTEGELVGKIVEPVSVFSSKVRLITSSTGGVGAYLKKNKLEGLLTGNNSVTCNFKYLIENKPVHVGDVVVSSGTDKIFLPYIPIGKVVSVEEEPLIQNVFVKPFFVEKSIKHLIVIKNE